MVTATALPPTRDMAGRTVTTVDDSRFRNTPATTIADIVKLSPGVAVIQGKGPRDVGVSIRGSNARNRYETGMINALASWAISPEDRVTFKLIYNEGEFQLSTRLSRNQYRTNPYQKGCETAAEAALGCGTVPVLVNGINGVRIAQTAEEGGSPATIAAPSSARATNMISGPSPPGGRRRCSTAARVPQVSPAWRRTVPRSRPRSRRACPCR
ncbi:Plug domain-containing protein [uncultured Sphingomonas sp.]|uniref:Plug domain-containing protein n=1 Tax=uncultured Sphingomonas sp. TaxID=158754 RepID=UPI0025F8146E|nr:Plug domain-containing protein [uncultured Sphingomonas sp.]